MAGINTKFMTCIGARRVPLRTRWTAICVAALAMFAVQASPARVYAQNRTWASNGSTQSGTSAWSITSNWNGGGVPNASDVTANFTNTTATFAGLTANVTIGNLTRSAGNNTSGNKLTITGTDNNFATQTPSGYELAFATTTGTAPAITTAGRVDVVVKIAGTQGFTKAGTADLYLWAPNTYTGTTTISAGRLRPQAASNLGSIADGTVVLPAGTLFLDTGVTIADEPLFISGTGNANQGSLRANGSSGYGGPITATGDAAITANGGQTLTLSSTINPNGYYLLMGDGGNHTITGGFVGTSGTVNFGGTGLITLSGSSSFTGVTQVGNATGLVTMTGYMAGLMDFTPAGARTLVGTGTFDGGLVTNAQTTLAPGASAASNDYGTLTASTLNLVSGIVQLGIQDATTYDRLVMTAGSGGLTLGGATKPTMELDFAQSLASGTWNLLTFNGLTSGSWANVTSTGAYAGPWSRFGSTWSASGGSGGAVGSGTISSGTTLAFVETTGNLTIAPLPLSVLYSGTTITDTILIGSAGGQVGINSAGATTFSGPVTVGGAVDLSAVAGGTATFTSTISGTTGVVNKTGPGTVIVTAANTYTSPTAVTTGALQLGNSGTVGGLSPSSAISIALGATFVVNRSNAVTQGTDFSTAAITGAGGFTQAGFGTTTLTAENSYTGATNVDAGKLLINGNQAAAIGAVTVAAGATLGGSGTVGGNTTITGIHSPGNSPGIQTFNGNLTYEAGAVVNWELIANSTGSPGTNFDQIVLPTTGNLTFNGSTTLALSFNGAGSAVDWSNTFWNVNRSWMVYDLSAGAVSNAVNLVIGGSLLDSLGNSLSPTGRGYFNTSVSGQDVMLNFVAVPEPSTIVLVGGSVAVACLMRCRRRGNPDGTRSHPVHPSVAWSDK
jgi:fibronectin-binding autotransporter adhesin